MEPEPLRDLRALLAWAGGRQPLRLAGEARPAELETFARDLFAEPPPPEDQSQEAAAAGRRGTRRARVRSGAGRAPWRGCALLFALLRAASLEQPREKRRLREILRDLRAQLPDAPTPAVVGVVLLRAEPEPEEAAAAAEAARLQLEGLLRGVFRQRRRKEPGLPDTVQAVAYRPGDGGAAREAACRALRAALKLRADGAGDPPRQKLPAFLSCIPWGRRNEDFHMDEDAIQDLEGAMALTNIAPNGKCEEASEALDT
ncbi:uncharacterized protein C2orf72 homolog isoform X2 [Thamnophis elegans]|uniref:uncharacterized protein C2orf72 homolog isoform X2 n=1 Tax=Thamnophis elegans TaxID=35005 RepID=UPI0013782149|nr:uncharacterized protein C2orf72 homolog isoform X2 [Thamnophis elegans]